MNAAIKAAIFYRPQSYCFCLLKAEFFHSTIVLERKRPSSSSSCKSNGHKKKRSKKFLKEHQEKIRRALEEGKREKEVERLRKEEASKKARKNQASDTWRKRAQCSYYDTDFDYIFRSLFGEPKGSDYSTHQDEERRWWHHSSWFSNSSSNSWRSKYRYYGDQQEDAADDDDYGYTSSKSSNSWKSKYQYYDQEDKEEDKKGGGDDDGYTSKKPRDSKTDLIEASHRQTLGLSLFGPLKLEDVKQAYRTCALKWHPDRHSDSTKVAAEAKFKLCSVAYQFLMEKLPVN